MKKQTVRVRSTTTEAELDPSELEDYNYTSEAELRSDLKIPVSILGTAQSAAFVTPDEGEALVDLSVTGQSAGVKGSGWIDGNYISAKSDSSGLRTSLKASYGLTDNFYFGAGFTYLSSTSSSSISGTSLNLNSSSKTVIQGITEPHLLAGTQTLIGRTRLVGELEAGIPIGPSKLTLSNGESQLNAVDGGSSFEPRLIVISDVGPVRLLSQVGYKIYGERETERQLSTGTQNDKTSGGNVLSLAAGLELPKLMNLGALIVYSTDESSETKSKSPTGELSTSSSSPSDLIGGAAYMGIPLTRQGLITPRLSYLTTLDRESSGIKYESFDAWTFGLDTKFMF